jgi:hypothetical protein
MAMARANPRVSVMEIVSGVLASGAGFFAADLWHRFSNTYDPASATPPTHLFTGGDGTAANAKNIASPPSILSAVGQAALTVAPFAGVHFAKLDHPHVKAALYGFGIGAGAHLVGQGVEYGVVRLLSSNPWVSRLFPQEFKALTDKSASNMTVSGTLGAHPPFIEELHTMFPHVPKHLLHAFGIGYGPSYSAGPYALQPGQHQQHAPNRNGLSAPPDPPPPPMVPAQPLTAPGVPSGSVQLNQPCPTPESRNANLQSMFDAGQRELSQGCESMGLGKLPHEMCPDTDSRSND